MTAIQIADLDNGKVDVDHVAKFANSTELTATDRMGRTKRTLAGIDAEAESRLDTNDLLAHEQRTGIDLLAQEQRAEIDFAGRAVLASLGYQVPVSYAAALNMTMVTQTVEYEGNTYAPVQEELPFTTSGTFEIDKFRLIQGVSGADLTAPSGAAMVGFKQSGAGAVTRTVLSKLRDQLDLRDFGAVGNGSDDDTAAILAAMASLPASGGQINVSPGRYLHDEFSVTKPIRFRGTGAGVIESGNDGSVFLKASSVDGSGIALAAMGAGLENLTVQGEVGNGGDGVVLLEGRCVIRDVGVFGMGTDAVRIGKDTGPSNTNAWNIINLRAKNNGRHGLHISDKVRPTLPDANAGILTGADLQYNGECGMYLGNCGFNKFSGLVIQHNGTYGVRCSPSSYSNQFDGGDYEVNGRVGGSSSTSYYDFWIEAGSVNNKLFGGLSYNFPQSFRCDEPKNLIIGFEDGVYSGDKKYFGIQLPNYESSVATALDWYEEGTWIPVVEGISAAGTATYSTQFGRFTRIGNMVTVVWDVTYSGHTGTGDARMAGLPFTSVATPGFQAAHVVPGNFTAPANSIICAMVVGGTKRVNLYSVGTAGSTPFAALAMDAGASLRGQATYLIP